MSCLRTSTFQVDSSLQELVIAIGNMLSSLTYGLHGLMTDLTFCLPWCSRPTRRCALAQVRRLPT